SVTVSMRTGAAPDAPGAAVGCGRVDCGVCAALCADAEGSAVAGEFTGAVDGAGPVAAGAGACAWQPPVATRTMPSSARRGIDLAVITFCPPRSQRSSPR